MLGFGTTKSAPPAPAVADDTCPIPGCGGQLAITRGPVWVTNPTWGGGPPVREDSARDRRQSYVGCGRCDKPVPVDHPMQKKLDADWEVREALDKAEAERIAKIPPSPHKPGVPINPVLNLSEMIEATADAVVQLRKDHEFLVRRVAGLEKQLADRK